MSSPTPLPSLIHLSTRRERHGGGLHASSHDIQLMSSSCVVGSRYARWRHGLVTTPPRPHAAPPFIYRHAQPSHALSSWPWCRWRHWSPSEVARFPRITACFFLIHSTGLRLNAMLHHADVSPRSRNPGTPTPCRTSFHADAAGPFRGDPQRHYVIPTPALLIRLTSFSKRRGAGGLAPSGIHRVPHAMT